MVFKALRLQFPKAIIEDEGFNLFFRLYFPNGKFGYAGTVNGPLECDMYNSELEWMEGTQPYDSIRVQPIWDRVPDYYEPDGWEEEADGITWYNESVGMWISEALDGGYYLSVMVDRSDYEVAKAKTQLELLEAATNYIWMLEAATGIGNLIDGPDIILYPIEHKYQLANGCEWTEKRDFEELLDILYGKRGV